MVLNMKIDFANCVGNSTKFTLKMSIIFFECKAYDDIRKLYILNLVANVKTLNSFIKLMKRDDFNCTINLVNFV